MYRVKEDFYGLVEERLFVKGEEYPVESEDRAAYLAAQGLIEKKPTKKAKKDEQPAAELD